MVSQGDGFPSWLTTKAALDRFVGNVLNTNEEWNLIFIHSLQFC